MIVQTLPALECTKLLAANRLARLACARNGQPYVVPIYYAYADTHLYAFSMPGKKIDRGGDGVDERVRDIMLPGKK